MGLRRLSKTDHEELMRFLGKKPALNLFIIGDVESFGYQQEFLDLWGDWDDGRLRAVLLRYHEAYIPYAQDPNYDRDALLSVIQGREDWKVIHGKTDVVEHLLGPGGLEWGERRDKHFCELTSLEPAPGHLGLPPGYTAMHCGPEHVDGIASLQSLCFGRGEEWAQNRREALLHELQAGKKTVWAIKSAGQIVSTVETTAENSRSAMIIGVCTHPEHRHQGLASFCMRSLCEEQLGRGRTLCLFYDNPEAGGIYRQVGFRDIGHWTVIERDR